MVEILHTHDRAQAEMIRVALESAGILVHSLDDDFDPYVGRHVLAVSETDAPRAIAIRRKLERQGASTPARRGPGWKPFVAAMIVFWLAVYLVLRWFRL